MTEEVTKIDIVELDGKLERMADGIDNILLCQSKMSEDVSKIKDAIYNPEEGLYARLRALELWKTQTDKVGWIIITSRTKYQEPSPRFGTLLAIIPLAAMPPDHRFDGFVSPQAQPARALTATGLVDEGRMKNAALSNLDKYALVSVVIRRVGVEPCRQVVEVGM